MKTDAIRLWTKMVDGLTIMANGVKSGLGVTQAMERVAENMPANFTKSFKPFYLKYNWVDTRHIARRITSCWLVGWHLAVMT